MGRGGNAETKISRADRYKVYTMEEIRKHDKMDDKWLVIDGKVYDITNWAKKHPGGARVISHYAGEDATDAWTAFHNDKRLVKKFLNPLLVGEVKDYKVTEIVQDFRDLRKKVEDAGLMRTNPLFFMFQLGHIIGLEVLSVFILWYFGSGWIPYLTAAVLVATSQAQAGWTQHDYGHLSVFNSTKLNHYLHHFTMGIYKGASAYWWNFRHYQHHAKPNVFKKDPDVNLELLFLVGDHKPVEWGKQKRGIMPYEKQHEYFFLLGPPTLLPIYFHLEVTYFIFRRKAVWDLLWIILFFVRFFYVYTHFMSAAATFGLYMIFRLMESHWFVWVTQMNHIPMEVDRDHRFDWLSLQLQATCNVDQSWFNDWFTGHLNFQIEHHLFPTMPRHNYIKIAPMVKALCEKHGIEYVSKTLPGAFADLYRSLRKSGSLWFEAYQE